MKNYFTTSDKNNALSFAHAMGLPSETETVSSELNDALDFAYAMGLKKRPVRETKAAYVSRNVFVPQLKFV